MRSTPLASVLGFTSVLLDRDVAPDEQRRYLEIINSQSRRLSSLLHDFLDAERPGEGECGSGTGATARTAFRVHDDHITDWLRVQDIDSAPDSLS